LGAALHYKPLLRVQVFTVLRARGVKAHETDLEGPENKPRDPKKTMAKIRNAIESNHAITKMMTQVVGNPLRGGRVQVKSNRGQEEEEDDPKKQDSKRSAGGLESTEDVAR
jgi:hypothetical protein